MKCVQKRTSCKHDTWHIYWLLATLAYVLQNKVCLLDELSLRNTSIKKKLYIFSAYFSKIFQEEQSKFIQNTVKIPRCFEYKLINLVCKYWNTSYVWEINVWSERWAFFLWFLALFKSCVWCYWPYNSTLACLELDAMDYARFSVLLYMWHESFQLSNCTLQYNYSTIIWQLD